MRKEQVSLDTLGFGAAAEMFQAELEKLVFNIADPNQEDQRMRNFWTYFPDIPVGSIFSFCGPTAYKKTGDATYREHCSYDRSERIYAEKDLGKLLKVVKVVER